MATDLAEFVGAAIALNLLFGVPLFAAGPDHRGRRVRDPRAADARLPALRARDRRAARRHPARLPLRHAAHRLRRRRGRRSGFIPRFDGTDSVLLATGILGATVMPHVIYLHSALTQDRIAPRDDARAARAAALPARRRARSRWALAGLVNMSMLIVAASLFHGSALTGVDSIEGAHAGFEALVGPRRGAGVRARAAGLGLRVARASAPTPGQVVMQGFIDRTIPLFLRRLITMPPALVVLAHRRSTRRARWSSARSCCRFGIPFALVPLVLLTRRRDIMGALVNRRITTIVAVGRGGADHRAERLPALRRRSPGCSHARFGPMAARRHVPGDPRLAARRLDRPRARPADLRREPLHRRGRVYLVTCNAQPYSKHDWHWRMLVAHRFGHAAAPPAVHGALKLLDEAGIDGELARARGAHRPRRGRADVGPAGVGAAGVPAHPGAVGVSSWRGSRCASPT